MRVEFITPRGRSPRRHKFIARAHLTARRCLIASGAVLAACADSPTAPPPSEVLATLEWNQLALELVAAGAVSPPLASRAYAYLSAAQYAAAVAARGLAPRLVIVANAMGDETPSERAAISAASATILAALFPAQTVRIEFEADADEVAIRAAGDTRDQVIAGARVGRAVASQLLARANDDGSGAVWSGNPPSGAGYWSGQSPLLPMWGHVRPWYVPSGSALRAPPPPEYGSPAFVEALSEVRAISEGRTARQLETARFWADGAGTFTPPGHWNEIAAQLLRERALGELWSARIFAHLNTAMMDAMIACWDSKYTYWLARPWQVDPSITTPIGQPPHPSYPSGHACASGAAAVVLGHFFPGDAAELERQAVEACDSRVFAGIHYRFDAEAGMAIGEAAGRLAIAHGDELVGGWLEP